MSRLKEELESLKLSFLKTYGKQATNIQYYTSQRVDILVEAVLRLEAEQYDAELKINTFNKILDEYDEVTSRLKRLLVKYEEENKMYAEENKRLKTEILEITLRSKS